MFLHATTAKAPASRSPRLACYNPRAATVKTTLPLVFDALPASKTVKVWLMRWLRDLAPSSQLVCRDPSRFELIKSLDRRAAHHGLHVPRVPFDLASSTPHERPFALPSSESTLVLPRLSERHSVSSQARLFVKRAGWRGTSDGGQLILGLIKNGEFLTCRSRKA